MRKRSVDSRGETDASRSNENVGLLSSSPANPKREQQSVSAASTPTFNKAKLLFGSKPENTNLGSVLALNSSVSKLNTISETEKIKAPSKKLPILPPLNEAVSVKQKWVILLSKAKGGVHMIPRTFVINENDANIFRQKTQEQINQIQEEEVEAKHEDEINNATINVLTPAIYKSSSSHIEKISLKTKFNESYTLGNMNNLDESGGFNLDIDNLEFETTIKSSRNDDGFNRNPQKLLSTLIECRQDLKTEIEKFNSKITKVDKKIIEILQLLALTNETNRNEIIIRQKGNQFLDINNNMGRNRLNDSIYSFGLNSNNSMSIMQTSSQNSNLKALNANSPSVSVINSKSDLKLRPTSSLMLDEDKLNLDNNMKPTQETHPKQLTYNMTNNLGSNLTLVQPTITINEIKVHKSRTGASKSKKTDLAGSNASSIASAVAGASSILSISSNKNFQYPSTKNTSQTSSALTTSNYNVNIIPNETEHKYLTSSASDNLIKETPYNRKLNDKKYTKGKLVSEYDDDKNYDLKILKKRDKDYKPDS